LSALAGAWTFETAPHKASRCVIAGTADARLAAAGQSLSIDLRANETCPDGARWRAREDYAATLRDTRLHVICRLVDADTEGYLADNFVLTVASPSAMDGVLYDAGVWSEPVRWRRPAPPLVS
jgi:hypothetical protein